jgi:adenylate kinase
MAVYIVTGTPGVGKTTVLNEAIKGTGLNVVTFGDVMFEIARAERLVKDKDEMRSRIPLEKFGEIQRKAADKIAEIRGEVIVDTHASMKRPDGYYPGLPEYVLRKLKPKSIVVIEAKPSDIAKRRKKDKTRNRKDFGGAQETLDYQNINRAFAAAYGAMANCPVKIIVNEQGKMKEAAEKLRGVFK